jgi:hypothetical protein
MKQKILYLSIIMALSGCASKPESFNIPMFENVIEYNNKKNDVAADKEYMYDIMVGQLEYNEGNTKRSIANYEKSLALKKNTVAYTLLVLYYKENDYQNAKRIAGIIKDNNIKKDNLVENLLTNLLNGDMDKSIDTINSVLRNIPKNDDILQEYEITLKGQKDIADLLYFSKVDIDLLADKVNPVDFVIVKFFYLHDKSNEEGVEPNEAVTYLRDSLDNNNLLQNYLMVKTAYLDNYDISIYKQSLFTVVSSINSYNLDINGLERLYNSDKVMYNNIKEMKSKVYEKNYNFWYFMSRLEGDNQPLAIEHLNKAYSVIPKTDETVKDRDIILSEIIQRSVFSNQFDVSKYINQLSNYEDKKKYFSFTVLTMIKNNTYTDDYLVHYKGVIKNVDKYIGVSKAYAYLERNSDAMRYLDLADELNVSQHEIHLEKIFLLTDINKNIAQNEAEIYYEKHKDVESKIALLFTKLINKKDLKDGLVEIKGIFKHTPKTEYTIKDFEILPTYIYARYNYENGKYEKAKEIYELLEISNNYVYLADYGQVLWKLNQKTKAKKIFEKSRKIFDSEYLRTIIKELNIKSVE